MSVGVHDPMLGAARIPETLLGRFDPEPVEIVNGHGAGSFVLVCEHAGRRVPDALGNLGVAAPEMDRHIAYDIGADGLSRRLSVHLDAPLLLQPYSRLVIDCNRPLRARDCIPEASDGTAVPANLRLGDGQRLRRYDEIHRPFHDAIGGMLDRRREARRDTILVTVHSFTPRLGGLDRPWLLGLLHNRDDRFARSLMEVVAVRHPDIVAAHNEPYSVDDLSDYTIPVHGEKRNLPHVLLEIRNDQIGDLAGQERWASLLAEALRAASHSMRESVHGL